MPKRNGAVTIGAFVLGALALVTVAVVVWGSGRLFRETARYVCYFDGSINGLEVGAPVKSRGVPVGRVTRIQLRYRQRPDDLRVPVFIELDLQRLAGLGGGRPDPHMLDGLIARGLRARLENQSVVTGTLFVNFGLFPHSPIQLSEQDPVTGYPEIPTVPAALAAMGESVRTIVSHLETVDVAGMVQAITDAAASVDRLASTGKVPAALAELTETLDVYKRLGTQLDAELRPLLGDLRLTVGDARRTLIGIDSAATATGHLIAPEAPLSSRLNEALEQVTRAADAFRDLAEYLQRNPNALLLGKSK